MGIVRNFLKSHMPNAPSRTVPGVTTANRVANILQDIQGIGCRIEKPTDREGLGWHVVVDGSTDIANPDGSTNPPFATYKGGSFSENRGGTYGELVTISDGWLNVHGITQEYIAATDVVLAGGPFVFVYLWALTNDYTTNGIAIANGATVSDIPVSGSGRFNVVLWQYELDLVTGKYGSPVARSGGQDVNLMTPVRN